MAAKLLLGLAAVGLPAGCASLALTADFKGSLPRVKVQGGRFVDAHNRERHFRGVNVVYKDPPWLPNVTKFDADLSFVKDDVDLLASLGVNLIRLGVMWPGVVPHKRGEVDTSYLERVRQIIHLAAQAGIYTVVEPHQDEFNPRFCGEGVPDWWTEEFTTIVDFPVPVRNEPFGVPVPSRQQCDLNISFAYIFTHDCSRAFQVFWEKGAKDFGDYWATVATAFASEPAVLGGELFNEPFPGDVYDPSGKWRDNKAADLHNLQPFYEQVTRAVRAAVPKDAFPLAYEPSWPVGDQDKEPDDLLPSTSGFSTLPEEDAIYAFHYYEPPCTGNLSGYLDDRLQDAKRLGAVAFASEFNLAAWDVESEKKMINTFQEFETRRISYTGWQYKSYAGSLPGGTCTGCGNSFFGKNGLNHRMAHAMGRPFVGAVAGRTTSVRFDTTNGVLTLDYSCIDTDHAPTEVVVPSLWLDGLHVTVEGDPGSKVEQFTHPGRHVTTGVDIAHWRVVHVHHSAAAVHGEWKVRVIVARLILL